MLLVGAVRVVGIQGKPTFGAVRYGHPRIVGGSVYNSYIRSQQLADVADLILVLPAIARLRLGGDRLGP